MSQNDEVHDEVEMGIVFIIPEDKKDGDLVLRFPNVEVAQALNPGLSDVLVKLEPGTNPGEIQYGEDPSQVVFVGVTESKMDTAEKFASILPTRHPEKNTFPIEGVFRLLPSVKPKPSMLDGVLPMIGMATVLLLSTIFGAAMATDTKEGPLRLK